MAQIKVNSGLSNPKSINVYSSNQWVRQRIGKVFNIGLWKNFIQYMKKIYELGTEFISIIQVSSFGVNMSKQADHLLLNSDVGGGDRYVGCATDTAIDLTNFSKIYIDWEYKASLWPNRAVHLIVSTVKDSHPNTYDARLTKTPGSSAVRETVSLDVSGLTGNFYVRSHSTTSNLKIYKIWVE